MVTTTVDGFVAIVQQQHRLRTSGTTIVQSYNRNPQSRMVLLFLSSSSEEPQNNNTSMSSSSSNDDDSKKVPFFLDPNTKGGALVLMVVLFVVPYGIYQGMVNLLHMDEIDAGITVGIGFTVASTLAWMSTYLFRVATKDMTYVSCLFWCMPCHVAAG
jgi:hypothetical protein